MQKRSVEVVVISDLHLGTYACRAKELLHYLKSISPGMLILNGDFFDGWQFSKHYFPAHHISVIQQIFSLLSSGTRVVYITGNHDEVLRRYSDMELGNFQLADKLVIEINGKLTWIFHGDVFDRTTTGQARFWAKLGSNGYALLLATNKLVNKITALFGGEKLSLSKKIMAQFHRRIVKIDAFERKIADLAIEKKYDAVICGHIHQPQKRVIITAKGSVTYLNSGDWVEHMTALEFDGHNWNLFRYDEKENPACVMKPATDTPRVQVHPDIYLHPVTNQVMI